MFSQRKKFYQKKMFYIMMIACVSVFSFGLWMNQSVQSEDSRQAMKKQTVSAAEKTDTGNAYSQEYGQKDSFQDTEATLQERQQMKEEQNRKKNGEKYSQAPEMTAEPPYYFIQAQEDRVNIYYYDESGQGELIRTADISFSLLGDVDQELLKDGIVRHTEEEMYEFLQDFES